MSRSRFLFDVKIIFTGKLSITADSLKAAKKFITNSLSNVKDYGISSVSDNFIGDTVQCSQVIIESLSETDEWVTRVLRMSREGLLLEYGELKNRSKRCFVKGVFLSKYEDNSLFGDNDIFEP